MLGMGRSGLNYKLNYFKYSQFNSYLLKGIDPNKCNSSVKLRSSHRMCSIKNGVLKSFAKFTGKHLCWSVFLNKVSGLRPATLLKEILTQVFSYEFCKIFQKHLFYKTPLGDCFCKLLISQLTP